MMSFNIQTDGLHIHIHTSNKNYDMLTLLRMLYISIYNRIFTYYRNEDLIRGLNALGGDKR